MRSFVQALVWLLVSSAVLVACGTPGPGGPPSCTGGTACVCAAQACACSGAGRCDTVCGDSCQVACSSSMGCNGSCGTGCSAACSGTGHCNFQLGDNSQVGCTADLSCDVTCFGSCLVTYSGRATATTVECRAGARVECAPGVIVCGRACP